MRSRAIAALAAGSLLAVPTAAQADVFNGRIAFSSFRTDPAGRVGDIFTINNDGTDLRQLTTNPEDDAQSDWAPDGRDIAYRIRKPGQTTNFEVSRMTAAGAGITRLTFTPDGQASSQPTWWPDRSRLLFRRSGPGVSSMWTMGTLGENPTLLADPPHHQFYPTISPDSSTLLFATVKSPTGDTDRAIQTMPAAGGEVKTLFDFPGAFDSAPAWSPDGTRIAFESNARRVRRQPDARHGDLGHERRRQQPDDAHRQHAPRRGAGVVARRHDARLLERGRQPPPRHQRDDRRRRAPAHADRLRGA